MRSLADDLARVVDVERVVEDPAAVARDEVGEVLHTGGVIREDERAVPRVPHHEVRVARIGAVGTDDVALVVDPVRRALAARGRRRVSHRGRSEWPRVERGALPGPAVRLERSGLTALCLSNDDTVGIDCECARRGAASRREVVHVVMTGMGPVGNALERDAAHSTQRETCVTKDALACQRAHLVDPEKGATLESG